jgi:hypothetical protein
MSYDIDRLSNIVLGEENCALANQSTAVDEYGVSMSEETIVFGIAPCLHEKLARARLERNNTTQ